jgi:hypothetical protein
MLDNLPEDVSAYSIPLTDKQLMTLGRITAIWAQIDHLTDHLLVHILQIGPNEFAEKFGTMGSGGKIAELDLALLTLPDGDFRSAVYEFVIAANAVKEDRNHAVHGVWGFRSAKDLDKPAARHPRAGGKPLYAERLKAVRKAAATASLRGLFALAKAHGTTLFVPMNFYFGSPPEPSVRLRAKLEQSHADRSILRRNAKGEEPPPRSSEG